MSLAALIHEYGLDALAVAASLAMLAAYYAVIPCAPSTA